MKTYLKSLCVLSLATVPLFTSAQDVPPGFVLLHESGLHTDSLAALIKASDVIVEGRFGEVISNELSYGENNSKESRMRELGLSEEEVVKLALPVKRYELHVERVLKATYDVPNTLVLQIFEDPNAVEIFPYLAEQRNGQHLFFLTLNRDGTVALDGRIFDIKLIGKEAYYYVENKELEAFPDNDGESLIDRVERSIQQ